MHKILGRAATAVDDALEALTFDNFDDALTLTKRAVSLLNELAFHGVVDESARATELAAKSHAPADIETAVFAASDAVQLAAIAIGVHDPGTRYDTLAAHETAGSDVVSRRTAIQWIASAAALIGCTPARMPPPVRAREQATSEVSQATQTAPTPIAAVTPIDAMQWPTSDPFLFCAHHRDAYPEGNGALAPNAPLDGRILGRDFDERLPWRMYHGRSVPGFPRHPHRGFETVTVVREGLLDHADSLGATARFGGGDVQWLTAGGGIQHAEMFPLLHEDTDNPTELFQIWLNLPAEDKMVPAHFKMLWAEDIPQVSVEDADGRRTTIALNAGAWGTQRAVAPPPNSWAARADTHVAIWPIKMQANARFELPDVPAGVHRSLYVFVGEGAHIAGQSVANRRRVAFTEPGPIEVVAGDAFTEILLLQGRPIGEPVARRGPFVMNQHEEIQQAYADYRATQFGGWPWDDNAPVHGGLPTRFAVHPNGDREEPG